MGLNYQLPPDKRSARKILEIIGPSCADLFNSVFNQSPDLLQILFYTDLGSLIGDFDCGYSTEWKFSHLPATLILREINFG